MFVNEKVVQKGSKKLSTISTNKIETEAGQRDPLGSPDAQHLEPFFRCVKKSG